MQNVSCRCFRFYKKLFLQTFARMSSAMKPFFWLIPFFLLFGCSSLTEVDSNDISYIYDDRSNLCFAIAGVEDPPTSTLGMATVECEGVFSLLNEEDRKKVNLKNNFSRKSRFQRQRDKDSSKISSRKNPDGISSRQKVLNRSENRSLKQTSGKARSEERDFETRECTPAAENLTNELEMDIKDADDYIRIITQFLPRGMSIKVDRKKEITIYRY